MKQKASFLLAFLAFFLAHSTILAQKEKVNWKDDAVLVNGEVYAKMKKIQHGLMPSEFSVGGISGPELLYVKSIPVGWKYDANLRREVQVWDLEFNFIESGNKVVMTPRGANAIARIIYDNKLISGNAIDADAERRFIQVFNGFFAVQPEENQSAAGQTIIVNVNTANNEADQPAAGKSNAKANNGPVTLDGNSILSNSETIGKFREEFTSSNYSQEMRILHIYNASGEKVAEAVVSKANPQEWSIKILSNDGEVPLLYDAPGEKEKLFKWMADKGYLTN